MSQEINLFVDSVCMITYQADYSLKDLIENILLDMEFLVGASFKIYGFNAPTNPEQHDIVYMN